MPARLSAKSHLLPLTLIATWGLLACLSIASAAKRTDGVESVTPPSIASDKAMGELILKDWIDADRRYGDGATQAVKQAKSVTTTQDAAGGCDGIKNGLWGFHVASGQAEPWWQVDLGASHSLDRIVVYNRCGTSAGRTAKLRVLVSEDADATDEAQFKTVYQHNGEAFGGVVGKPLVVRFDERPISARVIRLQIPGRCSMALDEIEVYAADKPNLNVALNCPADQISVSPYSRPGTASDAEFAAMGFKPLVSGVVHTDDGGTGFSLAHTRDVIGQTRQLMTRLRPLVDGGRLTSLTTELDDVDLRLRKLEAAGEAAPQDRRAIYLAARGIKRQIAMCNPRLQEIDRLLFIKRHDSGGVFHMCDQYYGCNAKPGGGLFVLQGPCTDDPRLINLLEDSVVQQGRLAGEKLDTGAFLSPEVSYDGQTVLFAYSQAQAKETYQWAPEYSQHIFRVNADGSGLIQLTDGETDDFDPCFLPNGRILFISERRGGYLRCGRHCPVYTMFSMRPDGSDIICVSYHETHEWHPSITNDGMVVYSRWDYVDRDTNIAHHIWTCYPDGRDPRSFHGNYPTRRESRPWMEMSIRAIPDSNKFVAVTGAHHGHAFGSLVLIDPRVEDDGAMSQLTRLTPDVPFPEAEGRPTQNYMVYGTPWPLSEDDYLCVYGVDAKNRGIYWIDRFGNRELIYRDPEISCLSPMPLEPRPVPPVIPSETSQAAEDAHRDAMATISVMNVYDADFAWPENTRINALRVIQVLPKSTAPPNEPRIGVANQTNARAVLGTVPVEADGSAYFEAPVGKALYFQAIDQHGTAVQSMRSATYVHPGEQLTCQGCHENKHRPQGRERTRPIALGRSPSKIQADVDGSNPFSFVRLVQPVLDEKCVACHEREKAIDLSGTGGGPNGWTRSYTNLAGKFGFYFDVSNGSINRGVHGGSRTIAGQFGARASGLMKYLDAGHYGVELTPEQLHRLTLWLDCNSEFYGSYENIQAQAAGEIVWPSLE